MVFSRSSEMRKKPSRELHEIPNILDTVTVTLIVRESFLFSTSCLRPALIIAVFRDTKTANYIAGRRADSERFKFTVRTDKLENMNRLQHNQAATTGC